MLALLLAGCRVSTELGALSCPGARVCDRFGCWQELCPGTFLLGSPAQVGDSDEHPIARVALRSYDLMTTEVTLGTWNACVEAGACTERPDWAADPLCTRSEPDLPVTCIDWFQATEVCAFALARLPSEAEWEYAARGQGEERIYPWGNAAPACDRLVLGMPCGPNVVQPPCSKPTGNTPQGLCDLAGNAFEWCADWHHRGYGRIPPDGSPGADEGTYRVMRGGGIGSDEAPRTRNRVYHPPEFSYPGLGVRCARTR